MGPKHPGYGNKHSQMAKNRAISKSDVPRWARRMAANDAKYGRDSKNNPNNKPNGK